MDRKKIKDLVNVYNSQRIPLSANQRANLEKIYPYYGAQGIVDYVDDFIFDGKYILVAEDGENLRSNKQNICNLVDGRFWVNNHAHILGANNENITEYLYYNFNQIKFEAYITGSAQPKLNKENLLNIETFVHSKSEQQKITQVLSTLDRKIALNQKINTELEKMAKTFYDYWFVQFDFPDKNGNPYKSSGGEMVYHTELKREIPKGWEIKKLVEIANITMGQSPNSNSYNEEGKGTIFFQGCSDFNWRYPTVRQYTTEPSRIAKEGDILLSVRAPVGTMNLANFDCCIGRGLAALNSKNNVNSFLFYVMKSFEKDFALRNSAGTTFGSITKDDLFSLKLIYPTDNILKKYENTISRYNEIILKRSTENQTLTQLRDFLLPMLMNGQVEVV